PLLDRAQPPVEAAGRVAPDPPGVVPPCLDLAQPGLCRPGIAVDVQRLGLDQQFLALVQGGPLLGVTRGEHLATAREEGVLRGAEPFPQPLLDLLGRARRRLPLRHQFLEARRRGGPLAGPGQLLGGRYQRLLLRLGLLARRVEGGEVRAASPAPVDRRVSMRFTSVTTPSNRRAKWARPSSGVPACHDPTARSPAAVFT